MAIAPTLETERLILRQPERADFERYFELLVDEDAARYIGLQDASFTGFLDWILRLRADLNIPHSLAEIGIDESRADEIGAAAKQDPSDGGNPVKLTPADYTAIFIAAVKGVV